MFVPAVVYACIVGPGESMYRDIGQAFRPIIQAQDENFGGYTINNVLCLPVPGLSTCVWASTLFVSHSTATNHHNPEYNYLSYNT